jgi:hypothetical protein
VPGPELRAARAAQELAGPVGRLERPARRAKQAPLDRLEQPVIRE